MKCILWLLIGLALPAFAFAGPARLQASMVVTGTVTVNPDGSVKDYVVQGADKLPPAARQVVQATVPHWKFAPVLINGKATTAQSGMSLRIVADMTDEKNATVRVVAAVFGCDVRRTSSLSTNACPTGTAVELGSKRAPPRYPIEALKAEVGGEVFLAVEVGRDGRVIQARARQVNLYKRTPWSGYFRKVLTDSARAAALTWEYKPPTTGPAAAKEHWTLDVPVNYTIGEGADHDDRGKWNSYIPGPVQDIPWDDDNGAAGADAIAGDMPFIRDARFVLKTRLGDNGTNS